jgi:nicotinamide mononucleotide transporter
VLEKIGGSASFFDALTTAMSLASQWLLNRKRLESWVGWILVDILYIPLYAYKDLYLTAILYAVFLSMAVIGLRSWYAKWLAERGPRESNAELLGASSP